ncbi:unnamed protein product [Caretta caretta]
MQQLMHHGIGDTVLVADKGTHNQEYKCDIHGPSARRLQMIYRTGFQDLLEHVILSPFLYPHYLAQAFCGCGGGDPEGHNCRSCRYNTQKYHCQCTHDRNRNVGY